MFDEVNKTADVISGALWKLTKHQHQKNVKNRDIRKQKNQVIPLIGTELPAEFRDEIMHHLNNGATAHQVIAHYRQIAAHQGQLAAPPPIHGAARWAMRHDFNSAYHQDIICGTEKQTLYQGDGLFLGGLLNDDPRIHAREDNWLKWDGDGHVATLAPTGSGKSRYLLIPNLLRYKGSCVVLDVKGELYNATSDYRKTLGPVYKISPFDNSTHAFNPLSTIETIDDGRALAELLLPRTATGDARFYDDEAINFLGAYIWYIAKLVFPESNRTLDELRERTAVTTETLRADLEKLSAPDMPKSVRRAANVALTKSMDKGLPSLIQSLNQHLAIWDNEGLMTATSNPPDFDFSDLKDKTATVYITLPLDKLDAYQQFAKLVLSNALSSMIKSPVRPKQPVLFVMDEFLTLGEFPALKNALRTHRDAGVRLWYLLQDVAALKETYPQGWETFFTQSSLRTYFGTHDMIDAEWVSKQTGQKTVAYENSTVNSSASGGVDPEQKTSSSVSTSSSIQYAARPVVTPDEVIAMLSQQPEPGTRIAISRANGVANAIPHIMAAWDRGEFGMGRFGGPAYNTQTKTLDYLFQEINKRCFRKRLTQPRYIAYQDFSMGRGGHGAFHDIAGLYKVDLDAVVLSHYLLEVDESCEYLAHAEKGNPQAQQQLEAGLQRLRGILLHELIHREVVRVTGNPRHGHGSVFVEFANQARKRSRRHFGLPEATLSNAAKWPNRV